MFYEIYFLVGGFGAFDRVAGVSAGKAELMQCSFCGEVEWIELIER